MNEEKQPHSKIETEKLRQSISGRKCRNPSWNMQCPLSWQEPCQMYEMA